MFRFLRFSWKTRRVSAIWLPYGFHCMASHSPQFSRVPLADVFVTICFLRERVVSPLPNPPLFSRAWDRPWQSNGCIDDEIQRRMAKASASCSRLCQTHCNNHHVSMRVKGKICRAIVLSTLLCGTEVKKLHVFMMDICVRS